MDKREEISKKFANLYSENLERLGELSSDYINGFRERAIQQFLELGGIPDRKNEAYKYTNLEPWFRSEYRSFFIPGRDDLSIADNFRCEVDDLDVHELILVNGFYPTTNDIEANTIKLPK